ncbi:MAG: DUF4327 family protein [Oscillatoriales cyanobacterium SM2_1_8]|nr:DUF4327 family protein [Oscillatoriales cyanobacterium SM2_1_8]
MNLSLQNLCLSRPSYSIEAIREETRMLVERGALSRWQPLHTLFRFFPERERPQIELELELHEFLERDRIGDLLGTEWWAND